MKKLKNNGHKYRNRCADAGYELLLIKVARRRLHLEILPGYKER